MVVREVKGGDHKKFQILELLTIPTRKPVLQPPVSSATYWPYAGTDLPGDSSRTYCIVKYLRGCCSFAAQLRQKVLNPFATLTHFLLMKQLRSCQSTCAFLSYLKFKPYRNCKPIYDSAAEQLSRTSWLWHPSSSLTFQPFDIPGSCPGSDPTFRCLSGTYR